MKTTVLAIALLFAGAVQRQKPGDSVGSVPIRQDRTAAEREAWDQEEVYWESIKTANVTRFMNLWDERFVGWPYFETAPVDKEGIREQVTEQNGRWSMSERLLDYKLEPLSVRQYGNDIVIVMYRARSRRAGSKDGADVMSAYRMTHTWMKTDQGWRIIGGMSLLDEDAKQATR